MRIISLNRYLVQAWIIMTSGIYWMFFVIRVVAGRKCLTRRREGGGGRFFFLTKAKTWMMAKLGDDSLSSCTITTKHNTGRFIIVSKPGPLAVNIKRDLNFYKYTWWCIYRSYIFLAMMGGYFVFYISSETLELLNLNVVWTGKSSPINCAIIGLTWAASCALVFCVVYVLFIFFIWFLFLFSMTLTDQIRPIISCRWLSCFRHHVEELEFRTIYHGSMTGWWKFTLGYISDDSLTFNCFSRARYIMVTAVLLSLINKSTLEIKLYYYHIVSKVECTHKEYVKIK